MPSRRVLHSDIEHGEVDRLTGGPTMASGAAVLRVSAATAIHLMGGIRHVAGAIGGSDRFHKLCRHDIGSN
jgi:hypothetical protein